METAQSRQLPTTLDLRRSKGAAPPSLALGVLASTTDLEMKVATTIRCKDCFATYEAKRRDATRCPPCRLLAMLTYAAAKFQGKWKCQACGDKFRPAGKPGRLCGTCELPGKTAVLTTCRVCKEDRPAYERVPVCLPCVKDPEQQKVVVQALKRGQQSRKKANA